MSSEIREMTRVDGESITEDEEEYRREYFSRERLLVVTKEMVDARFREVLENDEIADILDTYPSERW